MTPKLGWLSRLRKKKEERSLSSAPQGKLPKPPVHASDQYKLGLNYLHGNYVKQDIGEAVKWISIAAENNHPPAQYELGLMYMHGKNLEQDLAAATKWIRMAAEKNHGPAQYDLGLMYMRGENHNQDTGEAVKWISIAAENNHPPAQYELGLMYMHGKNLEQNLAAAIKWIRMAANQAYLPAQHELGLIYFKGSFVIQDYQEAARWLFLAAKQGYAPAQYDLGRAYVYGHGVEPDFREAINWLRLAAQSNEAMAQHELGMVYYHGQIAPANLTESVTWLSMAAEQGYAPSQHELGMAYYYGYGVGKDLEAAKKWLGLASDQGHLVSKTKLEEIESQISQVASSDPFSSFTLTGSDKHYETEESMEELFSVLNKMIGLVPVKEQIYQLINFVRIQELRKTKGLRTDSASLHTVFLGSPGTGKTTVARIYGKMLKTMGLLSKGHLVETDRSGLVAGYIGQTELKTDAKVKQALGGILFIDEAYSLYKGDDSQWDYGREVVSILLKRMEDYRKDLVVIVAGYDKPMNEFLRSNEGLNSRFPRKIHFPDYTPEELAEIFELFCKEEGYDLQFGALELVRYILKMEYRQRDETFGNGRFVRNLFESALMNQSVRIAETVSEPSHSDLITITADDIRPLLDDQTVGRSKFAR